MRATYLGRQELARRLEELRERLEQLRMLEEIGAEIRQELLRLGCPVWPPGERLFWRGWILRHGDDTARAFLKELDAEVRRRAAEIEARAG